MRQRKRKPPNKLYVTKDMYGNLWTYKNRHTNNFSPGELVGVYVLETTFVPKEATQ